MAKRIFALLFVLTAVLPARADEQKLAQNYDSIVIVMPGSWKLPVPFWSMPLRDKANRDAAVKEKIANNSQWVVKSDIPFNGGPTFHVVQFDDLQAYLQKLQDNAIAAYRQDPQSELGQWMAKVFATTKDPSNSKTWGYLINGGAKPVMTADGKDVLGYRLQAWELIVDFWGYGFTGFVSQRQQLVVDAAVSYAADVLKPQLQQQGRVIKNITLLGHSQSAKAGMDYIEAACIDQHLTFGPNADGQNGQVVADLKMTEVGVSPAFGPAVDIKPALAQYTHFMKNPNVRAFFIHAHDGRTTEASQTIGRTLELWMPQLEGIYLAGLVVGGGAARNRMQALKEMRAELFDNIQIVRPIEPQVLGKAEQATVTTHGFNDQFTAMFGENAPALDGIAIKLLINAMLHGNDTANLLMGLGLHGRDVIQTNAFGDASTRRVHWRDVQVDARRTIYSREPGMQQKAKAVHDILEGYLARPEVQGDPATANALREMRAQVESLKRTGVRR